MDNTNHPFPLPSREELAEIFEQMGNMKQYIEYLQGELMGINEESVQNIELRSNFYASPDITCYGTKIRQFQSKPLIKQAVIAQQIQQAKALLEPLTEVLNDLLLLSEKLMMQNANYVHEALREASKTNPYLLDIVAELDELRRLAEEEEQEEDES